MIPIAKPNEFFNWPAELPVTYGPYRAVVERIVDGDTFIACTSVGLDSYPFVAIRLLGVNAPELREAGGPESKAFLEGLLPLGAPVLLRTEKNEDWRRSFERWVASVLTVKGEDVASEIVAAGHGTWR